MDIITIPVEDLKPNDYNPNRMTHEELEELFAEVKHLGRIPKPIVCRKNGAGYVIIDGEHNWRAAKKAGMTELPCEIIEADDFEAMRQTYKRNQHGTHDFAKQGRMFKKMMELRGLSIRQLSEEVELSEGTVRNSLLYDEMEKRLRLLEVPVQEIPVRVLRRFASLPDAIGEAWIKSGGKEEDLKALHEWSYHSGIFEGKNESDIAKDIAATGVLSLVGWNDKAKGVKGVLKKSVKVYTFIKKYARGGLEFGEVFPYLENLLSKFGIESLNWALDYYMDQLFSIIIDTSDPQGYKLRITPEEFAAIEGFKNASGLTGAVRAEIYKKTGELVEEHYGFAHTILEAELKKAPDYIRESKLNIEQKRLVWEYKNNMFEDEALEAAKKIVAKWGAIYYWEWPGWSNERAVHDAIARAIQYEQRKGYDDWSQHDLATALVNGLNLYEGKTEAEMVLKRALIAKFESMTREELFACVKAYQYTDYIRAQDRVAESLASVVKGA